MLRRITRKINRRTLGNNPLRKLSSNEAETSKTGDISFVEMERTQRLTAQRSLLIESSDTIKFQQIADHLCEATGSSLKRSFKCPLAPPQRNFYLVELDDRTAVDSLLKNCSQRGNTFVPSTSRSLQFDAESKSSVTTSNVIPETVNRMSESLLNTALYNAETTNQQFEVLVNEMRISAFSQRIRFFVASVIEDSIRSLFPHNVCHPFGSTVNGFGHERSDLDIEWELDPTRNGKTDESRSVFTFGGNKPFDIKKTLEVTADWLKVFVPYTNRVIRILNARVPIIKFDHYPTGLNCDITTGCNRSGVLMSKSLWTYAEMDSRVRPLVYSVRRWADAADITSEKSPGPWLTNFQIIVLVLYHLMSKPQPVLPVLDKISNAPLKADLSTIETLRPSVIEKPTNNEDTLDLLIGFFDFYAKFDFGKRGMSLRTGKSYPKPDYHPMFFVNPLEASHNMLKNINLDQLDRFVLCCRRAVSVLTESSKTKQEKTAWGVLSIFNRDHYSDAKLLKIPAAKGKNFDIKSLFDARPSTNDGTMGSLKQRHVNFSSD